jgi:NAD-dependent SIR2 family protein deacetylase
VLKTQPNVAYRAIAQLSSSPDALKSIAPNATLQMLTKNIDDQFARAFPPDTSVPSSSQPIELYGNLFRVRCTQCGRTEKNTDSPICPALVGAERYFAKPDESVSLIDEKDLPKCEQCRGLLRPDVVWFKEETHHLDDASNLISNNCDLLILVGTGLHVGISVFFKCLLCLSKRSTLMHTGSPMLSIR